MKAKIQPYYDNKRLILQDNVPLDTPLTVFIQPSTVCNIRCKYCIQSLSEEKKKSKNLNNSIMEMDTFREILRQLGMFPRKIKDVSFTGMGEPLCNKRLPEMIKETKQSGIAERVQFFTNGLLLSKETSLELIDAGLDELRISLQGIDSQMYMEVCDTKVNFDKIVENIKFFYENRKQCKLYIKIADIAIKENEEKFYEMFGDICDKIFIEKIVPLFDEINYSDIINNGAKENKYMEKYKDYAVCSNCFYTLNISPEGNVMPCCAFYNPSFFNIREKYLCDIWNGEKRKRFLEMQLKKERFNDSNCKNCFVPYNQQPEDDLDDAAWDIISKLGII